MNVKCAYYIDTRDILMKLSVCVALLIVKYAFIMNCKKGEWPTCILAKIVPLIA